MLVLTFCQELLNFFFKIFLNRLYDEQKIKRHTHQKFLKQHEQNSLVLTTTLSPIVIKQQIYKLYTGLKPLPQITEIEDPSKSWGFKGLLNFTIL